MVHTLKKWEGKIVIHTQAMKAYDGFENIILTSRARIAPVSWVKRKYMTTTFRISHYIPISYQYSTRLLSNRWLFSRN